MIHHWKKTSVGTSLVLAAFALGGYAYTRAHAAPIYHLADGVKVTPIEVPPDDVADLLDVRVYKFNVVLPKSDRIYYFMLKPYQHGMIVGHEGSGMGVQSNKDNLTGPITIALAPVGSDFYKSDMVKYRMAYGTGIGSGTFKNPFKGCNGISYSKSGSESAGLIYLIGGSRGGPLHFDPAENDIALALGVSMVSAKRL